MGIKDKYLDIAGGFIKWLIKLLIPKAHRDLCIGWIALDFGIFNEDEFKAWMIKKLQVVEE